MRLFIVGAILPVGCAHNISNDDEVLMGMIEKI